MNESTVLSRTGAIGRAYILEQHHLLRIADGRITGIDQLCTGLHIPEQGTPGRG